MRLSARARGFESHRFRQEPKRPHSGLFCMSAEAKCQRMVFFACSQRSNVKKWIIMHKVISFWPKRLKNRNRRPANAPKTAKTPPNRQAPQTCQAGGARQAAGPYKKKNSNDSENHWNFNVIDGSQSKNPKKGCACGKCEPLVHPGAEARFSIFSARCPKR